MLIDEAYIHFGGESLLDQLGCIDNLFISRTFSKAYGLAGFRLGALLGSAQQLKMLRRVASPYNVNGIALTCLGAALDDGDYIAGYVAQVLEGRGLLERLLPRAQTFPTGPRRPTSSSPISASYRQALVGQMRRRGILVRDRNSDPGCAGCVRITLGNRLQTERLLRELPAALRSIAFTPQPRPTLAAKEAQ